MEATPWHRESRKAEPLVTIQAAQKDFGPEEKPGAVDLTPSRERI
ncbi:hypothetical protein CITRIK5_10283 [Citricoccus sp. K5]|nr:hypothetical protein CITRIK5_10283 [Citricoccus sp. K5]